MKGSAVYRSNCPIARTLDLFGDRWTLLILRDSIFKGTRFYNDFLDADEKIATNILSARLKMLVSEGFLVKKKYEKIKTKNVYLLTDSGLSVIPLLIEFVIWGDMNHQAHGFDSSIVARMKNEKEELIKDLTVSIRKLDSEICAH